jgi:class 3 adenylate cyclase/streptogramin lyase
VTVLFCDLVGSTQLGERLDAEILRQVQSRYFDASSSALRRHGGQVEKFIGDAVMCVFGLPHTHEDDPIRACRAACDLLNELEALNRELDAAWNVRLAVRIGVNTGEVVAGDPSRGQALVTGDAVNTAARLEQAAGAGEVLIGELTCRLAGRSVQVETRTPIIAKGKAAHLPAYRLLSADSAETARAENLRTEIVGREPELERLRVAFQEVLATSRAELVLVTGEPGIGKSAVVAELARRIASETRVLIGRCMPYGEGITYWPFREIVESLVGDDDTKLTALLARDREPEWVKSRVLRAVGRADGELRHDETIEAVARLLVALATEKPLVVIVEDLHWAEPRLLELLLFLRDRVGDVPLFLLGTARTELVVEHAEFQPWEIRLLPLDPVAAEKVLESAGIDAEHRARVLAAASGNPLFLHQLRAAVEQGDLEGGLPPDLHALLGARLDRLPGVERDVLETAAVIGREFWPAALAALLPSEEARQLPVRLALLVRGEFISEGKADARLSDDAPPGLSAVFGSEGRLSFRHILIQDATYRSMSKTRVAELHERFAEYLEKDGTHGGHSRPVVAWHLEQAARLRAELRPGEPPPAVAQRAAQLLEEEGRRALAHDEPQAAAALLTRASVLAPERQSSRIALDEALARSRADPEAGPLDEEPAELAPGETLGGYEIESLAGRGGMGVVYRARDRQLGRAVAVKIISSSFARDRGFRERFQRESRLAAHIEHPNVIPVYRAGEDNGRLYIAMRYVEGTDLARVITGAGALDPERTARLLVQVAYALDAAHARGLVHRDVKPGNVLIGGESGEERVYLTDFGLSLERGAASGLTRTGQWVGTPAYAAPEQIRAASVDARTDVYALGAVLFHCLTGTVPFAAASEFEMLAAHLGAPPPRPSASLGVPRAFDAVVAKAMAKDPAARHKSAGDLGRAILAASHGLPLPRGERSVATGLAAPQSNGARLGPLPTGSARFVGRLRSLTHGRRAAALAGALALAGIAAGLAIALGGPDGAPSRSAGPEANNPAGRLIGSPIRLREPPERLAAVGGYVWALNRDAGRLVRIEPKTGRAEYFPAPIDLGGGLFPDIAGGLGSVWLAHANASVGGVDRIEPDSVEAVERIPLPSAKALFVAGDSVWATATRAKGSGPNDGMLARIDPGTNQLEGSPVAIGRDPADVGVGHRAVWVADRAGDVVVRVDPRTLRIRARIPVGREPAVLAVTSQAVWVANLEDRTLSRIDPGRNESVGAPLALGKEIDDLLAAYDALWVAAADGTVTRLDPATGSIIGRPIDVGRAPLRLASDGERLWVASASDQTLQAIQPGR